MKTINLYEAKTQLSKLVRSLEEDGESCIVLCRNGKPVADLLPHQPRRSCVRDTDPALQGAAFLSDPCAGLEESDWPEVFR